MPTIEKSQKVCFQRGLAAGGVNPKGFSDVTVITGDTEALGHGIFVDEKSVDGLMALLLGKSIPGYLTHDGAMWGDRLGNEIGYFSGFYRDGLKLKAKAFTFLNSFVKHEQEEYETLLELAEVMPDQFGLSVVFSGEAVWVTPDGEEVPASYQKPEDAVRELPSVRFGSVDSADFVKAPAANPDGLFTRQVDPATQGMSETIALSKHTEALAAANAASEAALSQLKQSHATELAAAKAEVTALGETHKTALAAKDATIGAITKERDEYKRYDIRLSGVAYDEAMFAQDNNGDVLPTPAATDSDKWKQFAALKERNPKLAAAFREKHLSADRFGKK